ncbi:hypothetical protein [Fulvivirga lutimaris]|uniref:hypothetical protein n=1 Tax=Fulvivirga lutimaris TaxID=1819566 RepID=UPI0012BD00EC|nr:hypothetical protein [Fulvivirga lutimaris]MTI38565.1 hypothetical protein [Fulvivirga lutimaris]
MRNVNIYRHKISMLLVYIIILGIASLTFSSCSTHRAIRLRNESVDEWMTYQWGEIKKSPDNGGENWIIYSRKIKGTNFLEYKIIGDIEASPKACIAAFRQDILNQAADLENRKYPTYEIVSESKDSLLTYVIHNEPFPLKDTEMSVMYIFFNDEDESTSVIWHEAWDESQVQISKKLNRVETFRGSWIFATTSDNSWQGANSVQFDPKGMPMWLVKPMVMKFLKNGLEDIKGATSK